MDKAAKSPSYLTFPAIRGIQAGREYYVTMCPLDIMCSTTVYNEEEVAPEIRAQRTLNARRVSEITRYILENPASYVFSAITVSVDSDVQFVASSHGTETGSSGLLKVPLSARFVINDGQHRRAAIARALKEDKRLGNESIPLVIFVDSNLARSQQIFADLNRYSVRPTKSLSVLYDRRDPIAAMTLEVIGEVPIFRGAVEFEKTSLSNRSTKLFTLSNVYQSMCMLLGKGKGDIVSEREHRLASDYWIALYSIISDWQSYVAGEVSSSYLRKNFVHSHGVVLVALGIAGRALLEQHPHDWRLRLLRLGSIDWKRSNTPVWEGTTMHGGKISKSYRNLHLTSILFKRAMGLRLSRAERDLGKTLTRKEG